MVGIIQKVKHVIVPSRELTYPTLGQRKIIDSKCHFLGDMLVPWRVCFPFAVSPFGGITKCLSFGGHWCFRNSCYYRVSLLRSNHLEIGKPPAIYIEALILTKTSQQKTRNREGLHPKAGGRNSFYTWSLWESKLAEIRKVGWRNQNLSMAIVFLPFHIFQRAPVLVFGNVFEVFNL